MIEGLNVGLRNIRDPYYQEEAMESFMRFLVTLVQESVDITLGAIVHEFVSRKDLDAKQARDLVDRLAEQGLEIGSWDPDIQPSGFQLVPEKPPEFD